MESLEALLQECPRLVALTGAGISVASGIPGYRNERGEWQRSAPVQHRDFVQHAAARRRYWARSMAGWPHVAASLPNRAHYALAALEAAGHIDLLVTQNVDRLHQRAGHRQVVDLHGRLDTVKCLDCGAELLREQMQLELADLNPGWSMRIAEPRPDGDAEVEDAVADDIAVPDCRICAGTLMPDVVFFGGTVPRSRVEEVSAAIDRADALLVVGSSLMVYSGLRFCRQAVAAGKPLVIINRGLTRGDGLATLKIEGDAAEVLDRLLATSGGR